MSESLQQLSQQLIDAPIHFHPELHPLPDPMPESFGERLEAYRERLGISKSVLAKRTGIEPSYFHQLIKNNRTNPSLGVTYLLAINLFLTPGEREDFVIRGGHTPEVVRTIERTIRKLPT